MPKKKKLYKILEPGGLTLAGKHFIEHQVYDLLAEGWGETDLPGALASGMIIEAGEVEEPEPAKKELTVKEKDND